MIICASQAPKTLYNTFSRIPSITPSERAIATNG